MESKRKVRTVKQSHSIIVLFACESLQGIVLETVFDNVASYVIGDRLLEKNWSNMSPNVEFFKIGLTDEGRLWCNCPTKGNVISGTEAGVKTGTVILYGDVQGFRVVSG